MKGKRIGVCITGSFCTFSHTLNVLRTLAAGNEVTAILSPASVSLDTRFFKASDFRAQVEEITGRPVMTSIVEAERIGPEKLFDIMLIVPCTGNTLAKLAHGITDTPVTMAVKSHLRGEKPVVIAVSTNDGLSGSAANLGALLGRRHFYFVPLRQDAPLAKPRSLVADMEHLPETIGAALEGRQLQPILLAPGKG